MAGKNYAFKEQAKKLNDEIEVVTLKNASTLTIYQLRQELTRRGVFDEVFGADGEKRHINTESCLQVLVAELVKEKDAADLKRAAELEAARAPQGESLQAKLAREKEERKQAALERSQKRQEDKTYFEARKKLNDDKAADRAKSATKAVPPSARDGDAADGATPEEAP